MKTWIALLRGVNVVGKRKLPMKDLSAILQKAGFSGVRTYIQSGNVVFQSSRGSAQTLAARIAQSILGRFGFAPQVMVLSGPRLAAAIRGNPFPGADADPRSLHLFFLSEHPPDPDLKSLARLKSGREAFALKAGVFYLHTPDGFADSAVQGKVERFLGVPATARNWRTVNQLLQMSLGLASPE